MSSLLNKAFTDTRTNAYFWTHDFLALITIVSTVSIVLETVPYLAPYETVFLAIEWLAVIIFTFEYIVRIYLTKPARSYIFSVYGLIDLLSIVPTYLGLGNWVFLKSARVLRLIRLLRLIRMAKIRHLRTSEIEHNLSVVSLNVMIYLTMLFATLLFFGILFYVVEDASGVFTSIPESMWWVFRVFVNDSSVMEPVTVLGGILYVAGKFVGLILLGALVGVVANIMQHYLLATRRSKRR